MWRLLAMCLMLTILTACGGTAQQERNADPAVQEETTEPRTGEELKETSPAPSDSGTRSFTHDFGTIEVPNSPQRIVGVYLDDFLLALGVKPLTQTLYGQRPLTYLQDRIGDLPAISPGGIDLELILEQEPDLILLAYPFYAEEGRYEQFSRIAPTYVFSGEDKWRDTFKLVAEVVGKTEEAAAWLDDYERKVAEARTRLQTAIGDETVMFVRFTRAERIQLYGGPSNFAADVLYQDLGLQPSELVKKVAWGDETPTALISAEIIPEFDADHIFITYDNPDNEDAVEFKNNPLWKNIPAVKKGNLHVVDMFHWMNDGPIAYSKKVDDVMAALLP